MSLAQNVTQLAPSCTDHELIVAVRGGNDRAFEELYGRYVARIRAYIHGLVGDHGRAEDVTQDVFIAALRRLRETDRPIVFKPWIYEIARNACIDEFRRRRRAQEVSLDDGSVHGSERLLSSAPAPDTAIENKQRLDDLRGAFQGLSESHHQIMVMRELEGLSYGQIGERMGMSKPVVESTLFRARRRLHAEYDELVSGRRCEQVQTMIVADGELPVRALGTRQRRQLARHLAHCQPCRRTARMAGLDDSLFHAPGVIGKIAALFPFPWLGLRGGDRGSEATGAPRAHSLTGSRPVQALSQLADPTGPAVGFGRAATAVAAAIVVAGAGGGIVVGLAAQDPHHSAVSGPARGAPPAAVPTPQPARGGAHSASRGSPQTPSGLRRAGSSTSTAGGAGSPKSTGAASTRTPTGPGSQGLAASRTVPVGSAATATVPGGLPSAAGLLGGARSDALALPKLGPVQLPTVKSITDALNQIKAPFPPASGVSVPKLQPPVAAPSDPGSIPPPLGRHSG